MFFSDLAALQKITTKQLGHHETRYGDHSGDPEIERMLNGSPLITGWEPTVQSDDLYAGDDQVRNFFCSQPIIEFILIKLMHVG